MTEADFAASNKAREVIIDYTNWKGERKKRRVSPLGLSFEATKYHPVPQWLMWALETKEGETVVRGFAMINIHGWEALK